MNKEEFYQKIQKMDFISRNSIYGTGKDIPIKKIEQDIGIILYSPVMFMLPKYGVAEDILAIKIIQHQSDLKSNTISFLIHYNNADAESFANKVIDGILNNFTIFICKFDNELNHMSTILCTTGKALKVLPVSVDEIKYHHVTFECHAFTNISGTVKGKQMANFLKSNYYKERLNYKMDKKPAEIIIRADEIIDYDTIDKFINENFRYQARYFYNDPFCIRDSDWCMIATGNDKTLLEQYCISKGFTKSERILDGGYEIIDKNRGKDI